MVNDVTSAFEAEDLAEAMLAVPLPRRWRHVRSVARRARWVAKELSLSDDLVAAAWLHDIGYAPDWQRPASTPWMGRATCAAWVSMPRSCAWWLTTRARISRRESGGSVLLWRRSFP